MLTLPDKTKCKPALIDSRNSFIYWIENVTDLKSKVDDLQQQRCNRYRSDRCPHLVVVGTALTELAFFFVAFGDTFYQLPTFLKALDVCFKIFKSYGLKFPKEVSGPWHLINHVGYGFPLEGNHRAKITTIRNAVARETVSLSNPKM